jgi:hypothetical protein
MPLSAIFQLHHGDSQLQVIKFTSCLPMVGDHHDAAEKLLKVALNTKKSNQITT